MLNKELGDDSKSLSYRRVRVSQCLAAEHHHEVSVRCVCTLVGKTVRLGRKKRGRSTIRVRNELVCFGKRWVNLRVLPQEVEPLDFWFERVGRSIARSLGLFRSKTPELSTQAGD